MSRNENVAPTTEIFADFTLECAHHLPRVPADHKCRRVHGHSYLVQVTLRGDVVQPQGWIVDYADLRKVWDARIHSELDHHYLNEVPGLENPTSENIAMWIYTRLSLTYHEQSMKVQVWETRRAGSTVDGLV